MIVGEAPGPQEWEAKHPFLEDAPAGGLLREELVAAGLSPEDVYITNVVKVYPPIDGRTSKKLKPSEEQIEAALDYLKDEIQHHEPKYILALGKTAIKTLTGSCRTVKGARDRRRGLKPEFKHKADVLPTYHPSYIKCRPGGKEKLPDFREDLARFATACKSPGGVWA
jgi:DNA polymerase